MEARYLTVMEQRDTVLYMPRVSSTLSELYENMCRLHGRSMTAQARIVLEAWARSEAVRLAVDEVERARVAQGEPK